MINDMNMTFAPPPKTRRFIPMFFSYLNSCEKLTDEEFGKVVRALFEYAINEAEPEGLNDKEAIAFDFMAENIAKPLPGQPVNRKLNREPPTVETLEKLLK